MEKVLREMVMQVCEKVKETEEKINQSYLTLRRLILSQVHIWDIQVDSVSEASLIVQSFDWVEPGRGDGD